MDDGDKLLMGINGRFYGRRDFEEKVTGEATTTNILKRTRTRKVLLRVPISMKRGAEI